VVETAGLESSLEISVALEGLAAAVVETAGLESSLEISVALEGLAAAVVETAGLGSSLEISVALEGLAAAVLDTKGSVVIVGGATLSVSSFATLSVDAAALDRVLSDTVGVGSESSGSTSDVVAVATKVGVVADGIAAVVDSADSSASSSTDSVGCVSLSTDTEGPGVDS
jgi:hypothetical protein